MFKVSIDYILSILNDGFVLSKTFYTIHLTYFWKCRNIIFSWAIVNFKVCIHIHFIHIRYVSCLLSKTTKWHFNIFHRFWVMDRFGYWHKNGNLTLRSKFLSEVKYFLTKIYSNGHSKFPPNLVQVATIVHEL